MRKLLLVGALWMAGCGPTTTTDVAVEQALSDESLQATVKMLQQKGATVDLNAAVSEEADNGFRVTFPVKGERYQQLVYDATYEPARVIVVGAADEPAVSSAVACGSYLYSNSCNYGPWYAGAGCSGGPLYQYGNFTRSYYQYGRRVSVNYWWYSCSWMAQDSSCTSTCG